MEQTIYLKLRNGLQVSPSYAVKIADIAQIAEDASVLENIQNEFVYKITDRDKTHVVIDASKTSRRAV